MVQLEKVLQMRANMSQEETGLFWSDKSPFGLIILGFRSAEGRPVKSVKLRPPMIESSPTRMAIMLVV